jgi:hypothetical protein
LLGKRASVIIRGTNEKVVQFQTLTKIVGKITRKIGTVVLALAVMACVGAAPVLGAGDHSVDIGDITDIQTILNRVITWAFVFFFALAGFFILWAAFDYLTAAGKDDKIKSAKNKLIYAAIGIAVALVARSVVGLIEAFIE